MINWYHYNYVLLRQESTLQLMLLCLDFKMYYPILFGTHLSRYVSLILSTLYILHTSINSPIFTGHNVCIPDHNINSYHQGSSFPPPAPPPFISSSSMLLNKALNALWIFFVQTFLFFTKNFHCITTLCL